MTYRDDREALKGRVEALERELADARRQGEEEGREAAETQAEELQAKIGGVRRELDRMEAELRELRGDKAQEPSKVPVRLLALVPIVVAIGGGFYVVFLRGAPAVSRGTPEPAQVGTAAPVVEAPEPPKAQPPAAPKSEPRPEPTSRLPTSRFAKARWRATVKSAQGAPFAAGSSCFVDATITTRETNTSVPELTVTCGTQVIYSSEESFNGVSQTGNDAIERMGATEEKSTFTLQYSDVGTRSGRAQIDLDSNHREAAVFRENIPRMRVELSLPVESEPTAPLAGAAQRLRRTGRVTEVSGAAPVKAGTECVLRAMPNGKQTTCVAEVRCGTTVLFPAGTPVECVYDGARPISVATTEGTLQLTMTAGLAEVKNTGPKVFSAALALDPAPSKE